MYLTSHKIRDPLTGAVGVNAFLHVHEGQDPPNINWRHPDVDFIARTAPGRLVASEIELHPGGNDVISYLDFAARDDTEAELWGQIFDAVARVAATQSRSADVLNGVGYAFYLHPSIGMSNSAQIESLFAPLKKLLKLPIPHPSEANRPITIFASMNESGTVFSIDPQDRARVEAMNFPGTPFLSVNVQGGVHSDFEVMHGEIFPHVVALVTGLPIERLLGLGGVRVLDQRRGTELWRLPKI